MRIALVCGNGLSIDRAAVDNVGIHPSRPLSIPVLHPLRGTPLIESLPHLRGRLADLRDQYRDSDYALVQRLLSDAPIAPADHPEVAALDDTLLDLRHYLAIAYSTYQLALDRGSMERWQWRIWFERYRRHLIVALNWNHDLVLERTLTRNRTPHFHPGAGGWPEWNRTPVGQIGVPVCKPHGSCHFAPDGFEIRNAMTEGGTMEPCDYPRAIGAAILDAPQRTMRDGEILSVRTVADIVLPGEFNLFGQHLSWMRLATRYFRHYAATADTLVAIGFSMGEPDRREFADAMSWVNRLKRAIVVDPTPSEALLDFLSGCSASLEVWRSGPQPL